MATIGRSLTCAGDGDVWDGELLRGLPAANRVHTMCLSVCSDGSILKRYRNHTYTPILVRLLNLPPHLRTTATGVLMWAELPPGVANFKSIYRYLIGRLKDNLDPDLGDLDRQTFNPVIEGGMQVYDAHAESTVTIQVALTRFIEDTRGLHHVLCSKQCPAHVGACPFCTLRGFTAHKKTVYPGAITHLPMGHSLRREFQEEFKARDDIKLLATERHRRMTTATAYAQGQACEEGSLAEEESAFKAISPFNEDWALGPDFDVLKVTMVDMAHALNNFILDMYRMIGNSGNMQLTPKRWARECAIGRFTSLHMEDRYVHARFVVPISLTLRPSYPRCTCISIDICTTNGLVERPMVVIATNGRGSDHWSYTPQSTGYPPPMHARRPLIDHDHWSYNTCTRYPLHCMMSYDH